MNGENNTNGIDYRAAEGNAPACAPVKNEPKIISLLKGVGFFGGYFAIQLAVEFAAAVVISTLYYMKTADIDPTAAVEYITGVINTSLLGNTDFLGSKYVGASDDSSKTAPAVFVLDSEGKYIDKVKYDDEEVTIKSDGTYAGLTSDLKELKAMIENFNGKSSNKTTTGNDNEEKGA